MTELKAAEQRVAVALEAHGLPGKVIVLEQLATTAQMAAEAIGVEVGRIVKSLLFVGAESGTPYLILVSGDNRVHERRVGRLLGEKLERSDADFVKQHTGFSIGGVSPLAHATPPVTLIDRELFRFSEIWAAAGHPHGVFRLSPQELQQLTGAPVHDLVLESTTP